MGENLARVREGGCVLVVDDEPALRATLEALLEESFRVITAASAAEALSILRRHCVDVVITDHHMPGGTGTDLIRGLQSEAPTVICILMTGHVDLPEVRAARSEKVAFHVLIKPINPEQLLIWVRTAVQSARLRTAVRGLKRHLDMGGI